MKKTLFLIVALAISAFSFARPVSVDEASGIAANYWHSAYHQHAQQVSLVQTDFAGFYVFDINEGHGFVIVSSDDLVYPILACSDNSAATNMGPETRFWLNQYEAEIAAVVAGSVEVEEQQAAYIKHEWEQLRTNSWQAPKNVTTVPQLMTTIWNQSPYYNDYCPSGTPVGCTATATAQVMKYWNHPAQGTGSHSYYSYRYGTQSANYGETTYQWDLMPNSVTASTPADQRAAVALLSYHVGVGCDMDYGPDGSGAQVLEGYGASAESALKNYFSYKSTMHGEYRSNYSDATWVQMLKDELDASRPVIYAGYDASAGHCFVFDGYNASSLFHVNWGWGSAYDGYYALGALNPGGGGTGSNSTNSFNQWNQALFGVEPIPTLHANPASLILSADAESAMVQVTSSGLSSSSWHASANASWLSVTPTSGSGNGQITNVTISASANTTGNVRNGVVTLIQNTDTARIPVMQLACGSADMCQLTMRMAGSNDNGWYGAKVTVASTSGVEYGTFKLASGVYAQQSIGVCSDTVVLTWHMGTNDGVCAFSLMNSNGDIMLNHTREQIAHDGDQWVIATPCAAISGLDPVTFTINAVASDTVKGHVDGGGELELGSTCSLFAYAQPGYRFVKWNDNTSNNPRTISVTQNRTITATFATLGTDTLQFDNGTQAGSFGSGNNFRWAVRLSPEELVCHSQIKGVRVWVSGTGTYYAKLYTGDEYGPDSLLGTAHSNMYSGSTNDWGNLSFSTPVRIDHGQSLWVVCYATGCSEAAVYANWCGSDHASWFSEDGGMHWQLLTQQGDAPIYGTWPVRIATDYDNTQYILTASSNRPSWGTVSGGGTFHLGETAILTATPAEGYHLKRWTDQATENPHRVVVVSDTIIRAIFAAGEPESISDVEGNSYVVSAQGRVLTIQGAEGMPVAVYDVQGRQVISTASYRQQSVVLPAAGVYVVRVNRTSVTKVVAY